MGAIKEIQHVLNFWRKEKRVVTIIIMYVYNREVSKFSQKIFVIAAIKLY